MAYHPFQKAHSALRTLAIVAALVIAPAGVQAGQLFPPLDSSGNSLGTNSCPAGTMLSWTGQDVKCVDVSSNVTTTNTCKTDQAMVGMSKGSALCQSFVKSETESNAKSETESKASLNVSTHSCSTQRGSNGNQISSVTCPSGKVVTKVETYGGGGVKSITCCSLKISQ